MMPGMNGYDTMREIRKIDKVQTPRSSPSPPAMGRPRDARWRLTTGKTRGHDQMLRCSVPGCAAD
jgi:CheY-like chemotaxis protein